VSQIPKIKSEKVTGTWNASRMTTFQGQSAKRQSSKKNFENGQTQRNTIFIFWLSGIISNKFLCYFTSTSVADSENQITKGHRNLESQQNDNIPRAIGKTSIKL